MSPTTWFRPVVASRASPPAPSTRREAVDEVEAPHQRDALAHELTGTLERRDETSVVPGPLKEAARELRVQLAGRRADTEKVFGTLLALRGRMPELRAAYAELDRPPRDLVADFGMLDEADALRANRYFEYGTLREVDKVYLAIKAWGTDPETLWRVLPGLSQSRPDDDFAATYGKEFPTDGLLLDRSRSRIAGALEEKVGRYSLLHPLTGKAWELDKAKALLTFGGLDPVDDIRFGANREPPDGDMVFTAIRKANPATVVSDFEQRWNVDMALWLRYQLNASGYEDELERALEELDPKLSAGGRLIKVVKNATTVSGTTHAIWDALGAASPAAREALKAEVKRGLGPNRSGELTGIDDFFGGLNAADLSRLKAMLRIGTGDPTLDDPEVVRLRARGGVTDKAVLQLLKGLSPEEFTSVATAYFAKEDGRPTALRRYVDGLLDAGDTGFVQTTLLGGSFDKRLDHALDTHDEAYLTHLLKDFADDGTRQRLSADEGFRARVRDKLSTGVLNKLLIEMRPKNMSPEETAAFYRQAVEREGGGVGSLSATAEALADENRELQAVFTRARQRGGELTDEDRAEAARRAAATQAALEAYIVVRDRWEEAVSGYVSLAVGFLLAPLTGGASLAEATALQIAAAVARAALANAVTKVLTQKAIRGDRFDVFSAEGAHAFVTGSAEGVLMVFAPGLAERAVEAGLASKAGVSLMEDAARNGMSKAVQAFGKEYATKFTEGAIFGAPSAALDSMLRQDTWKDGFIPGLANALQAGYAGGVQGAEAGVAFHALTKVVTAGVGRLTRTADLNVPPGTELAPGARGDYVHEPGRPPKDWVNDPESPSLEAALHGDSLRLHELLGEFGSWEEAIEALQDGTGAVAGTPEATRKALIRAEWENREAILDHLAGEFNGRTVKGSSQEPGSDKDVNFAGSNASANLLAAEQYLSETYGLNWRKRYRMAIIVEAERVAGYVGEVAALGEHSQLAVKLRAEVNQEVETLTLARRIRHASPEERATLLDETLKGGRPGVDAFRAAEIGTLTPEARLLARNKALIEGDRLTQQHASLINDPEALARNAVEMAKQHMLANALEDDAYISPGAIRRFVQGGSPVEIEHWLQAGTEQLHMIDLHVSHVGELPAALRSYEIYKYSTRFAQVLEAMGVRDPVVNFVLHHGDLAYRLFRRSMQAVDRPQGVPREKLAIDWEKKSSVRFKDADAPTTAPTDTYLLDVYKMLRDLANRQVPVLERRATAERLAAEARAGQRPSGPAPEAAGSRQSVPPAPEPLQPVEPKVILQSWESLLPPESSAARPAPESFSARPVPEPVATPGPEPAPAPAPVVPEAAQPPVLALGRHKVNRVVNDFKAAAERFLGREAITHEKMPDYVAGYPGEQGIADDVGYLYELGEVIAGSDPDHPVYARHDYESLQSGVFVQRALDGRYGPEIFISTVGVDPTAPFHTPSELRQILVALAAGNNTRVTIHLQEDGRTSTILKGTSTVVGDPLPGRLLPFLPESFSTPAEVGRLLTETFPSTEGFNDFARRHFPGSFERLGEGMDLASRQRLVLEREGHGDVLRAIARDSHAFQDRVAELFHGTDDLKAFIDEHWPLLGDELNREGISDDQRFRELLSAAGEGPVARRLREEGRTARPAEPRGPEAERSRELDRRKAAADLAGSGDVKASEVEALLARSLPLDSDFEAFLISHFADLFFELHGGDPAMKRVFLVVRAGEAAVLKALQTAPHPIHDLLLGLFHEPRTLDAFLAQRFPGLVDWVNASGDNVSKITKVLSFVREEPVIEAVRAWEAEAALARQGERGGRAGGSREQRGTPSGRPPPGIKGSREMADALRWGKTTSQRPADLSVRTAELTLGELQRAGITLADAQWWRDTYRWMKDNTPFDPATGLGNQAAPGRFLLLQKAVLLLGGR